MEASDSRFTFGNKLLSGVAGILPWGLLGFALAFYAFPSSKSINNWFYVTVALPALILVFTASFRDVLGAKLIVWVGLLSACLIGSTALNINPDFSVSDHIKPILYVLLFVIAFLIASEVQPNLNQMIASVIIGTAFIAAIYTIYAYYEPRHWRWVTRLRGLGGISNPIWVSGIYAVAVLLSVSRFMAGKGWLSYGYIALALPSLAVVWLSQSRAPLIGLIVAMIALCVLLRNRRALMAVLAGISILVGVAGYYIQSDQSSRYLKPPTHRLTIWNNAIDKYLEAPVLGHGLHADTTNISKKHTMQHYHNVYLTIAVQGGIVSLLVLLALAFSSLRLKVTPETLAYKSVLILGLVYMLSNGSDLFSSPKELWLLFWLPILAIWGSNRALSQQE